MQPKSKEFYEFAEFRLDVAEKVLRRDGELIPLTPKVFETLQILVENAGHLLEKNDLMERLWQDRIVEENNLTFNIKMLRKALGDRPGKPCFIETVPRRGYRFIADVREPVKENEPARGASTNLKKFLLSAAAVLTVVTILAGIWYARARQESSKSPILSAPLVAEKLTTNGKTLIAVISPDGKNMVYTQGTGNDKQSVWLRQLETGNNVEIVPPTDDFYYGLALSPDGNFLYFVRYPRAQEGRFDVFRVSIFGGIPTKILSRTEGWISLSADGATISFVRCAPGEGEYCSLWIADAADGQNERKIFSRPRPIRIGDNKISPDGKSVVFAVGQSETQSNEFSLMEVEIETGAAREVTPEKFFNIAHLEWYPGRRDLLINASKTSTKYYRLWLIPAAGGEAVPLTQDSESYWRLSLDRSAEKLISVQTRQDYHLHFFETENPPKSRVLADATSVSFTSDGKILFTSMMSGNDEIWSINADGSEQRQLTNNPADENAAVASPAKDSIFFASNRTGQIQVWKMDADGSNQTQITREQGGAPLLVSPDGRWVYYHHGLDKTLWRVSADGGEEELILNKREHHLAVSPDCTQVAFEEKQGAERLLTIVRLADGQTLQTFKFAEPQAALMNLKWSPDSSALMYVSAAGEYENNTLWKQKLDGTAPQKIADLGNERITAAGFALAPNGKSFAVAKGGWRHDAVLLKGLK